MRKFYHTYKNYFYVLLISLFSIGFNFYYGYVGIFPIDSFLIFDSGHNVLNGSYPFKDYWAVTGPLLDYFQAFFFLVFGSNWFSYVLHAAIINLILALFSYFVFYQLGLNFFFSFLYACGISILAYPSIGTPFIDHHSTIFSIFAIYCFILGIKKNENIFWFLIPVFLSFAFLSKQIPASYIILFIAIILLFYFIYDYNLKQFIFFLLGIFFSVMLFVFVIIINKIPLNNFFLQYIFYPISIGQVRVENLNFDFKEFFGQFKFIYICLIPLAIVLFKILLIKHKTKKEKMDLIIILLIISTSLIFIYTQLLTRNQVLIFFLIPMITAFAHIYLSDFFNKKYFLYLIIFICLFSVTKYHFRFNEQKKFVELENVNLNLAIEAGKIHEMFGRLKWITPHYPEDPQSELINLIEIKENLNFEKRNIIIISDYQFFNVMYSSIFVSPNKWYDDISVPDYKNKYFSDYKNFFINKLKKNQINAIYSIGIDKFLYFKDFIMDKNCINSNQVNEMLIIYDISDCDL